MLQKQSSLPNCRYQQPETGYRHGNSHQKSRIHVLEKETTSMAFSAEKRRPTRNSFARKKATAHQKYKSLAIHDSALNHQLEDFPD